MRDEQTVPTVEDVHQCLNGFYDGNRKPFILSLDGGGIYGLTEAIWLKQLCEAVPGFLAPGQVRMFAGCSAGSLNALLLAMHNSPREAVLCGVLEDFWTKSGILSSTSPVSRMPGTAMYAAQDAIGALEDTFEDMTLGDLWPERQGSRVLVSTFNYTGEKVGALPFGTPFDHATPAWSAFRPDHMFRREKRRPIEDPKAGQTVQHWRPKFFDNHGMTSDDKDVKLVDIAMAAVCVPGVRPFRGGFADGGLMSADPSVGAIAHLLRQWEMCVDAGLTMETGVEKGGGSRELSPREQIKRILTEGTDPGVSPGGESIAWSDVVEAKLDDPEWVKTQGKGVLLNWTKLLSVGPGQALPAYGYANLDIGMLTNMMLPFNPFDRNFWPADMYKLDQPSSGAEYTCSRLLSEDRFLRLDPDVMRLPTLAAAMVTWNDTLRGKVIDKIYEQTETEKSRNAVAVAAEWLIDDPTQDPPSIKHTGWYQQDEHQGKGRERVTKWQAERDAREAARLANRPKNPWGAWTESVQRMMGGGI